MRTRVAAITGGRGAIGAALDRRLTAGGWTVVALDLPATAPDEPAARERWVALDTTHTGSVAAAFEEVEARCGRLDLLVIAAGVTALGSFEQTADETFRRLMDVNFHGAVACLRAALPALRQSRGHVVALSSVAGFAPVVGRPAYVASKHALTGTFEALRPELEADGITVTLVHPTFVANELADANAAPDGTDGADGVPVPTAPSPRTTTGALVTPEDVATEITRAVARGRDRVLPGRTARLAYHVHRLAPGLYERLMTRRLR